MADFLEPTPVKRPLALGLAKLFGGLNEYANDPNNLLAQILPVPGKTGVGLTSGFASLVGLPDAEKLLEKLAYGESLTQGKGQTFSTKPGVFEGAATLAPLAGGLAKGAYSAAGKLAPNAPKLYEVGALYKGAKDPNLYHGHATDTPTVVNKITGEVELPREFYNLSMGVTRDAAPAFGGLNSTLFVPHLGQFDPKTWKSILTATDYYVPRYGDAAGSRLDEMRKLFATGFDRSDKRDYANRRLADRLGVGFPRGGFNQEGAVHRPPVTNLRYFGNSRDPFEGQSGAESYLDSDIFKNRIWASPRAQSFAHFETDPRLGPTIGSKSGHQALTDASKSAQDLLENIYSTHLSWDGQTPNPIGSNNLVRQLKMLASGFVDPMARSSRGRRFDKDTKGYFDFNDLRVPLTPPSSFERFSLKRDIASGDYSGLRAPTPDEIKQIRQTAGKILSGMARAPSDYGELKVYGPVQINPANFAGVLGRYEPGSAMRELERAAKKRGLPFEQVDSYDMAGQLAAINSMQNAGKKTTVLTKGLAESMKPSFQVPDTLGFGDIKDSVKASVNEMLNLHPSASWLEQQILEQKFKDSATNWLENADNFVSQGHISHGEKATMEDYIHAKASEFGIDGLDNIKTNSGFTTPKPTGSASPAGGLKTLLDMKKLVAGKSLAELKALDVSNSTALALKEYDKALEAAKASPIVKHSLADGPPIDAEGWKNIVNLANQFPKKEADGTIPILKSWKVAPVFKSEFPGLSEEQATALSDLSHYKYMQAQYGDAWATDVDRQLEVLKNLAPNGVDAATKPKMAAHYIAEVDKLAKPGIYFSMPDISKAFPELTIDQVAALSDYTWLLATKSVLGTQEEALAAFAKSLKD